LIDDAQCRGCGLCVVACPFGAVHLLAEKKTAWKCNQCADRVSGGLPPSCVQHCAGGALQYVTPEELARITAGRHSAGFGKVCYVSAKWRLLRGAHDGRESAKSDDKSTSRI
jgi:Fe-S-cluster-containing dehydrogenase component